MDPNTPLDYALFQLTPTRTRCDLVVFSEGEKEKLASGLVEPFLAHLRYAKEQIPKGGYSITLRPPTPTSWFTKGTLERFVRFVSTPEVLERFVTIEREITQIELSIQANELSNYESSVKTQEDANNNGDKSILPFKSKVEGKGSGAAIPEENSKIHLQRVLETRKAVLRKEQAMAYYRAFVAGYEMECIDDLLAFADAFGASRLSDACMNFKELCYKKHNDGLWMDELAAMETYAQPELPYLGTSGITLTTENNNLNQTILQNIQNGGLPHGQLESNGSGDVSGPVSAVGSDVNQGQMPTTTPPSQFPMSWPNQLPQFMYNFPNQQMPPYQGYPFPGMHPSHYQGNMHWPPNRDSKRESSHHRDRKVSSKKKEKPRAEKASNSSEQDEHTEASDSTSEDELDAYMEHDQKHSSAEQIHKRKNGKKSSRMVVIRNINYITSKKKDGEKNDESEGSSADDDEFIDGDALKQSVRDAVGSLEKHKSNSGHHKKKGGTKVASDSFAETSQGVQTNENWGAFQNLLLKADDTSPNETETERTVDVRDEYFMIQGSKPGPHVASGSRIELEPELGTNHRIPASDSFVITEREKSNENRTRLESFVEDENLHVTMKKRDYPDEEFLYARRNNDVARSIQEGFPEGTTETSLTKTHRGEDWFIINQPEKSVGTDASNDSCIFGVDNASKLGGDYFPAEKDSKRVLVDDSFMIQDRSVDIDQSGSQWRTDISMVSGLTVEPEHNSGLPDSSGDKCGKSASYEPDDLYMVLDRNSGVNPDASWDYGMDMSLTESRKQHSNVNVDVSDEPANVAITDTNTNGESEKKKTSKDTFSKPTRGSLGKSKNEIMSRNKKPYTASRVTMQKTKFETEEETRKRMEELVIERQKRIAERSTSKKSPGEVKKVTTSDRRTSQAGSQDTKKLSMHKSGPTNSTANRPTSSTVPSKQTQSKKPITKVPGALASPLSVKTARDENAKLKLNPAKSSKQTNGLPSPLSEVKGRDQVNSVESNLKVQIVPQAQPSDDIHTLEDKELRGPSTHAEIHQKGNVDVEILGDKGQIVGRGSSPSPVGQHSSKLESSPIENGRLYTASPTVHDEKIDLHGLQGNKITIEIAVDSPSLEPKEVSDSTDFNFITTNERNPASTEILEEVSTPDWIKAKSTPPSTIEISLDQSHSRKKWDSDDHHASATAKGLKKLLMFGRKKSQVAA